MKQCDRPVGLTYSSASSEAPAPPPHSLHAALTILGAWILLSTCFQVAASAWENAPGYRRTQLEPPSAPSKAGFTLLPPNQTGLSFTNSLPDQRLLTSQILPNGSGVTAGDVDGDGWCDLYFCGLKTGNRLYRNLGNWKFEDITQPAGVACTNLDATGAAFADLDGDSHLDLIVNSIGGGTHVFINDGKGHFTAAAKLLNPGRAGTSLALADIDGDGLLDLYIANYRVNTIMDIPNIRFSVRMVDGRYAVTAIDGRPLTDPEWTNRFDFHIRANEKGSSKFSYDELGEPDALYRNLGNGRFESVPFTGGAFLNEDGKPLTQPPFDWGLSVVFRDLNGDGLPDIYVCNDFRTPDRIWLNDGRGHFRAINRLAIRQTPLSSMSVDIADINRDGLDDIFTVDMLSRDHRRRLVQRNDLKPEPLPIGAIDNRPQYPKNTLLLNRGDGTYAEVAQGFGLEATEWSWAPIFLDVDLDGYEDLLVTDGFERDNMNIDAVEAVDRAKAAQGAPAMQSLQLRRMFPRLATANLAFRNLKGTGFTEVGHQWGFDTKVISQGACLADLDNDGDLDVIVNNLNEVAGVYRNNGTAPRVAVRLKGLPPNTRGIGAKIRVYDSPVPLQSQEMLCGGRYLSSDDSMRIFAAGPLTNLLRIEVSWRSGRKSVLSGVHPNYLYEIDETGALPFTNSPPVTPAPFFADVSSLLAHSHHEDPFDDFARQPCLPKRFSQLGPGVCWCDLNSDGWDDLVIASGKGGSLALFLNDGKGGFRSNAKPLAAAQDQTTVLAWPKAAGSPALLIGSANYEDASAASPSVQQLDPTTGKLSDLIPGTEASTGPLALGDFDGDGNLDLFVGGRLKPGHYPEPVNSRLFRNQSGTFVLDQPNSKLLEHIGLVSSALWSDLDGDGFPELILACEWGPIRIFHNDHGHLAAWDLPLAPSQAKLSSLTGWWNGLATGDLDGDGRLDIIASNWGSNSKYQSHRAAPLRLYYGDFNEDGSTALLESYFEPEMGKYVPERRLDIVARSMPFLRARFSTHQAYANSGIDEILGDLLPKARYLEANWLESTVFLNGGDRLQPQALPMEAQFTPAVAVVVADYDGDGCEDLFLSQNFFAAEPETARYDAGRGLWLKGDGHGAFRPVPGPESGVTVYGEQRGAAVADYDGDGRVDLVVTQNGAETRLFKNLRAMPGLRVRLKGPTGNPSGIGAQLRLKNGSSLGPLREIHAGSGYWSQDSAVQVLTTPFVPTQLWIRWPGGKTSTAAIPAGSAEVQLGSDGVIARLK